MCHHREVREWEALGEEFEEAEADSVEGEAPTAEPEPDAADDRLPPIQPSD